MIQDSTYEQLVKVKKKAKDKILPPLIIVALILFSIGGILFVGLVAPMIGIVLGVAAYFLYISKVNVEYEYVMVNSTIDVDVIYNQTKRKSKMNINLREAEVICPKKSATFKNYKPEKFIDFSTQTNDDNVYAIITTEDQVKTCIFIEPDARGLEHLKNWGISKFKAY